MKIPYGLSYSDQYSKYFDETKQLFTVSVNVALRVWLETV